MAKDTEDKNKVAEVTGNGGPVQAGTEGEDSGAESGAGKPQKNFSDLLYEEITAVIGGDNPNQFFCISCLTPAL